MKNEFIIIFCLLRSIKGVTLAKVFSFLLVFLHMFSMTMCMSNFDLLSKCTPNSFLHLELLIGVLETWIFVPSGVLKIKGYFPWFDFV